MLLIVVFNVHLCPGCYSFTIENTESNGHNFYNNNKTGRGMYEINKSITYYFTYLVRNKNHSLFFIESLTDEFFNFFLVQDFLANSVTRGSKS